jgi:hypothetical protein
MINEKGLPNSFEKILVTVPGLFPGFAEKS